MNKISKMSPGNKMSEEIEYWNTISQILEPAKNALDEDPFKSYLDTATLLVKKIFEWVQLQQSLSSESSEDKTDADAIQITPEEHKIVSNFEQFQKQKMRLIKGYKEAIWNYKYMSLILPQVSPLFNFIVIRYQRSSNEKH